MSSQATRLVVAAVGAALVMVGCHRRTPPRPAVVDPPPRPARMPVARELVLDRVDLRRYPEVVAYVDEIDGRGEVVAPGPADEYGLALDEETLIGAGDVRAFADTGEPLLVVVALPRARAHADLLEAARPALARLLDRAGALGGGATRVALVTYAAGRAQRRCALSPVAAARACLDGITAVDEAEGGLEAALLEAHRALPSTDGLAPRQIIVCLDDGAPAPPAPDAASLAARLRVELTAEDVTIAPIVLATTERGRARTLRALAKAPVGLRHAATAADVARVLDQIGDGLARQQVVRFASPIPGRSHEHLLRVFRRSGGTERTSDVLMRLLIEH